MSIEELEAEGLTPLSYFANALSQLRYPAALQPATAQQDEHLLVAAGKNQAGDKFMVRLRFLEAELLQGNEAILELLMVLPGQPRRAQLSELNQLAAWFNRLAPMGAFVASPEQGLCYRYLLLSDTPWVSINLLVRVLNTLSETAQACNPYFEACLAGTPARSLLSELEAQHAEP